MSLPENATINPEGYKKSPQSRLDEMYVNNFYFDHIPQSFAVLKLAITGDNTELKELYTAHVAKHNAEIQTTAFPNSGFDLFVPDSVIFDTDFTAKFVSMNVKCEMLYCDKTMPVIMETEDNVETVTSDVYSCGYYVYPRSSISKTPLMLANHVGIIDAGYRGNLIGALRKLPTPDNPQYVIEKHTRLFQVCHPSLCPVFVVIVPETELNSSERGEGGFGSTGTTGVSK
jgi:dUTP pyrophosphatase